MKRKAFIDMTVNTDQMKPSCAGADPLKLENQLCFPLYVAAKGVVKRYTPLLKKLDLTYTQYIAMMVMWEREKVTVNELGSALHLDSGTLTPLLKKMEAKGLVTRTRDSSDERRVIVEVTPRGADLHDEALSVPLAMGDCVHLSKEETFQLRQLLERVISEVEA